MNIGVYLVMSKYSKRDAHHLEEAIAKAVQDRLESRNICGMPEIIIINVHRMESAIVVVRKGAVLREDEFIEINLAADENAGCVDDIAMATKNAILSYIALSKKSRSGRGDILVCVRFGIGEARYM